MDNTDLVIVVAALAAGVIIGFVGWTYIGPLVAGAPAAAAPTV
jgi:hypothetical protein